MDYRLLTERHHTEIKQRKLFELEAEHARLALDLRLAGASGIENESVATARAQLDILVLQTTLLREWMTPQVETGLDEVEVLPASGSNGSDPAEAT